MLRNNNMAVISRMARRSLKSNRRRSITVILAVLLSTFMLFGVLTVGITYFKMQRVQNIRLSGGAFDAVMYGLTDEQRKMCENNPDIQRFGVCAVVGDVKETKQDKTPNVRLMWADETWWTGMMKPAREWVQGEYPKAADEVMATEEALKECGLEGLSVGDVFTMTYRTKYGSTEKSFLISGMWSGYGSNKDFYMSEEFYRQTGYALAEVTTGRCYIDFKQKLMTKAEQNAFIDSMKLGKQQQIFFTADIGYSVEILSGIIGLVLVTCLCAYLLIYNIMYLSVAGNIRYYGLLQTIGMTGRQVNRLMQEQMLLAGGIGIIGGVLTGCAVSFFLVPSIVKTLGIRAGQAGEIVVAFHPAVFLLTVLLTGITLFTASRKPVKMAVTASPMEALGYRPTSGNRVHKAGKGKIIWRMAKEQIRKDKKKSGIVMLSLGVSLSVFLCMVTLIGSQGAREFEYNYMDMDMKIQNDTINRPKMEEHVQLLDEKFLKNASQIAGIKEVHPVIYTEITVPWETEFSDIWMREFYEMWMMVPYEDEIEEYKAYPENFGSTLVGIDQTDFDCLNQTLHQPVDKKAFLEGKTCILYRNDLDFKDSDLAGKKVTCAEYTNPGNSLTFEIAGLTDEMYYNALLGCPPTIIVSDRVVKEFVRKPLTFKAGIRYDEEYDEQTEAELLALIQDSPYAKDFSYSSKINLMKNVKKAQGNMMEVGIGIVGILAFIGILNYVNTTVGSIQSRLTDISVMESIGMTEKQIRKMLIWEGLLYTGGAWMITLTAGLAVTYGLYQSMNYRGASFSVPVMPVAVAAGLVFLLCVTVPMVVYSSFEKRGSVVERIRGQE